MAGTENTNLRVVNYLVWPIFSLFLVLHILSLFRKENRNLFSMTILISLIVSVSIRIILTIAYLFVFEILDLKGNIYQQIFFEIPYYCYIIVSYAVLFCWYLSFPINLLKGLNLPVLVVAITTLGCDTIFVIIGAKDHQLGYILFSIFWVFSSILFLLQILLLILEVVFYVLLTRYFLKKTNKARQSLLWRETAENRVDICSYPKAFDQAISDTYQKNKVTFHLFFAIYILSLALRMGFYIDLRVESSSVQNDVYIWEAISPDDHYFFYIDEIIQNIILTSYFCYTNGINNKINRNNDSQQSQSQQEDNQFQDFSNQQQQQRNTIYEQPEDENSSYGEENNFDPKQRSQQLLSIERGTYQEEGYLRSGDGS
ncbi:UNKNOWN [Stylonychia lemnae]|uniref:Transmembrane protein n=1 Tax=Stylonychia lemnae TaxID=5949 RepID=A0A077ZT86_STYLE|nr:UNKNOWN [Stylonychia lemnae]|eukprot:CDW72540.1 UNKNOWN [Stylonychia lemnae]